MKTSISFLGAIAAGALALTGCATVNTVENSQKSGQRYPIADQRVITDESFNSRVAVIGVNAATTSGNLLKVQVELENHSSSIQRFLYRFEWFDANGMQMNNIVSANIPEQIEGGESKFIYSVAPNPVCKDFRVKFIAAK
ncbi:MAG TPA: YcfL family protein [Verrucomicrobiae bacterium]|jgi:uncharacterized protein YcfL